MSPATNIGRPRSGGSLLVGLRLRHKSVLVVGGGQVGSARVVAALEADARVTVVSPVVAPEVRARWARGELQWRPRVFELADLDEADLVLSCLDDREESARIARACRARRLPVSCADHPDLCDFWFASAHREGPLQLALSTNGQGPALGRRLLDELRTHLPEGIGETLRRFGDLRRAIRAAAPGPEQSGRRMGWLTRLSQRWSWEALATLDEARIATLVERFLHGEEPPDPDRAEVPAEVLLVGAGPGDPELLTVAARRALDSADLVLADRLIPPAILQLVRGELRIARKRPGRADLAQAELDAWGLAAARAGRRVVRLKCGDPFVFGRGGEELRTYEEAGLRVRVIPGLSSALAAPVAAAIPTTLRGAADRVLVLTGQGRGGSTPRPPAWASDTTYVVLMGVSRLPELSASWIEGGFPPDTPAAVVASATRPDQAEVRGTLADIAARAAEARVRAPAVLVIGTVAGADAAGALGRGRACAVA